MVLSSRAAKFNYPEFTAFKRSNMSAFLYTFHRGLICLSVDDCVVENGRHLRQIASKYCGGIPVEELSVIHNGHLISEENKLHLQAGDVCYTALHLPGGKGGFGSMLRALGAQIEKTTNREACRDLSGRRMRDINDEKKIAEWVSKQAEREREQERQKQERKERKRRVPKHTFDDASYTRHIQENSERIEDALQQGLKAAGNSTASSSSTSTEKTAVKRAHTDEPSSSKGSKKSRMWLGMGDLDSDEDEEELITSENKRKDAPATCTSTATSCTSTQAEPSTSNEGLDNICHLDAGAETTAEGKLLEAETSKDGHRKDEMKDVQEMQSLNKEGEQSEDGGSAAEQVTDKQSCQKVMFCLDDYTLAKELESLGMERLKEELMAKGLKCGGTLQQRAQRLFATKGVPLDQLDPSFFAKPTGNKKSNGKK